ncbi:MAG: S41 family peptidase [Kiritimatiellia bacterium]|nr:S41 family peptidase [Kiritimatiellia bacterium]MDP6631114.1 S41 family peptidase [Kiritimatiellia bacterium]MDP6810071.1 S41 family peptidase [Kiritimatiellia bacterium]MDP7024842.1 S41 family peptidase [Kiritimatiellia bacterium]
MTEMCSRFRYGLGVICLLACLVPLVCWSEDGGAVSAAAGEGTAGAPAPSAQADDSASGKGEAAEVMPSEPDDELPEAPVVEEAPDPVIPSTNAVPGEAAPAEAAEGAADEPVDEREVAYDNMELMAETIMHIRKHYVEEKTFEDIAYGALHGMLRGMDPHSDFLEPTAYEGLKEDTRGTFSGIGIHIGIRHGILTVIAPIEGTPAYRAGLLSGDRIVEIEGESTVGESLREAVGKLRGERGSGVTIKILREGEDEALKITIVRDDIEVSSVKGSRMLTRRTGYIRITQFAEPTAGLLQEALEQLLDDGMEALVLDLRSNPGGLLRSAVAVAEKFIEEGDVVVSTRGRANHGEQIVTRAKGALHYTDLDVAVLVNGGSASASEIVAGCLQDHGRAVLVGQRTFGKGSVQSVIRLRSNAEAAIRLTTAHYYTPSDRLIHNKGIEPDISIPVPPKEWRRVLVRRAHVETPDLFKPEEIAEYEDADDRPMQRAIDMLEAVLIFEDRQ